MEDIKLTYSKDWRNPSDFPTVEPDETRVREDMQLLYSEIQTFLNETIIPIMRRLETPGVEQLPVEQTVSTSRSKIPSCYAVARQFSSNGNLPIGGAAGQFLVKTSDEYADAAWLTYKIPGRVSDLVAVDEDGNPVNAQTLLTDLAETVHFRTPELLFEGILHNGTVLDISSAADYDAIWFCFDCDGNPSLSPAAIYFGAWNGRWVTDIDGNSTVDETGMLLLSRLGFDSRLHTSVGAEISVHPIADGTLLRYQHGTRLTGGETIDGGLLIRSVGTSEVPDHTKITMFSEAVIPDTGESDTQIRCLVYGIRRGKTPEVI